MNFADEIESDLRLLVEADFGRLPSKVDSRLMLLNWLHFQARKIPQRSRAVIVSPQVNVKRKEYPAIDRIERDLRFGADLSPYLSDRIRKEKTKPKADPMFNDWQISHFHLGNLFERKDKVGRTKTGALLFAHIRADRAVLIDVQPHGVWSMQHLLEVLLKASPKDVPEMKGIIPPPSGGFNDEQLGNLRRNGYGTHVVIDGKVYLSPGMGISTSGHATRLVMYLNHFQRSVQAVRFQLAQNTLPSHALALLGGSIGIPIRLGVAFEGGQLRLVEKSRGLTFVSLRPLE